jgi:hypothetical protein
MQDRLRNKSRERWSIDYVKRSRNASTSRLWRPTTLSKLAITSVVLEAERGCRLAQPTGSTEAPGATG